MPQGWEGQGLDGGTAVGGSESFEEKWIVSRRDTYSGIAVSSCRVVQKSRRDCSGPCWGSKEEGEVVDVSKGAVQGWSEETGTAYHWK